MDIHQLMDLTVSNKASDLHLLVGIPPAIRVDGTLRYIPGYDRLTKELLEAMLFSLLTAEQKELLIANKELDFSVGFGSGPFGEKGRFRINAYFQRGYLSAALRFLPATIRTITDLGLPNVCQKFANLQQGFVLVTGPTGHGKSTTLAAIVNEINLNKAYHILSIEDPIEYLYPIGKSIVSQRELNSDTHSWAMALKSALREDPDVVFIGEMRDPETMQAAMTIAETGHLVFATLHTNSSVQSIDRVIDSFPPHQRAQIQIQLAATLKGIISQRLLPKIGGGMVPAVEILLATNAVANNIREGKSHLINSVIQTSREIGMMTIEDSLAQLVRTGIVNIDDARAYAQREDEFMRVVGYAE